MNETARRARLAPRGVPQSVTSGRCDSDPDVSVLHDAGGTLGRALTAVDDADVAASARTAAARVIAASAAGRIVLIALRTGLGIHGVAVLAALQACLRVVFRLHDAGAHRGAQLAGIDGPAHGRHRVVVIAFLTNGEQGKDGHCDRDDDGDSQHVFHRLPLSIGPKPS